MSDEIPTIHGYPDNSREEHLANCKAVALWTLDHPGPGGGPENALGSLMSDLGKHPETRNHAGIDIQIMLMLGGHLRTTEQVRRHIEGFR